MGTTINTPSSVIPDYSTGDVAAQGQAEERARTEAAGKALTGNQPSVMNLPAVNVASNLDTNVRGVDASSVAHTVNATYGLGSSVPELPWATVSAPESTTAKAASIAVNSFNLTDSEAYRIIQKMSQSQFALDAKITTASQKSLIATKQEQVGHLEAQIKGEQKAALSTLAYSILGAGTSATMAVKGTQMRQPGASEKDNAFNTMHQDNQRMTKGTAASDPARTKVQEENRDIFLEKYRNHKDPKFVEASSALSTPNPGIPTNSVKVDVGKTGQPSATLNDSAGKGPQSGQLGNRTEQHSDASINAFHKWRLDGGSLHPKNYTQNNLNKDFASFTEALRKHPADISQKYSMPKVSRAPESTQAIGAGVDSAAQGVGGAVTSFGALSDKVAGGQHEADQAKIAQKQDDVAISLAQQVLDSAKSMKEKDLKEVSEALDKIKDAAARYAAVIDKIG